MNDLGKVGFRSMLLLGALLFWIPCALAAEKKNKKSTPSSVITEKEAEKAVERSRLSADVDRQAKLLFEKAMELMEYKQYERGLAMLNAIVRDNQGNILAHRANMAMGKHFLSQNKPKEAQLFSASHARPGSASR
jgi:hypothetical protein